MNIRTEFYIDHLKNTPSKGQQIIGHYNNDSIVVYQAYNANIADYAVKYNKFGGDYYSFNRMSWIKPNFLWMMYRSGWATKQGQERILAIWLSIEKFKVILECAVHSTYILGSYKNQDDWKNKVQDSEVRIQWDPDHAPDGSNLMRRAIQLGLKGMTLRDFCTDWITQIEDITDFVINEREKLNSGNFDKLVVPIERTFDDFNDLIKAKIINNGA